MTTMWGRNSSASLFETLQCFGLFATTPFLVVYFMQVAFYCDCDLYKGLSTSCVVNNLQIPRLDSALYIVLGWILLQLTLASIPDYLNKFLTSYQGGVKYGLPSPAGIKYDYQINGLQAWIFSLLIFGFASQLGFFSPTVIYDNWSGILIIMAILAYTLSIVAYVKAHTHPTVIADRKFTSSNFYDYFMGIELNPRTYNLDWKLFLNGRPGIIGWSLINISFASAQYHKFGEAWYIKTLDISLDHFGWMFAFGDLVWLPAMYTLQGLYLVQHPVQLSNSYFAFVSMLGLVGFYIFSASNNEKDDFKQLSSNERKAKEGEMKGLFKKKIDCEYKTSDGTLHTTSLLISGWWGLARHINYTGDVILSLAYSLACGYCNMFPYFYVAYLTVLLLHRTIRDEAKCSKKYGNYWSMYCNQVPYRFIPGLV